MNDRGNYEDRHTPPDRKVRGVADAFSAATISCTGLDITIACDDHDTKDAIFNLLEALAVPAAERNEP